MKQIVLWFLFFSIASGLFWAAVIIILRLLVT
jgi:hypothetical protein